MPPLARAQTNLSLERYNAERRSQQLRARESPEPQVVEGNELAHYNLGLAFRQKGYYNEALREYRLALERGEDRRLTLQAMAEVHLLKRDFGAALELYETLIREVPDSPKLWNERGVVLHQAGRTDDALASYRQAAEVDPKYALAWNNLGVLVAHAGDTEEAIEALRTALQLRAGFSADVTAETLGENFAFDERLLDNIFQELQPAPAAEPAPPRADDPLALARDYVSKGLMDVAAAEATRAVQRGADRAEAAVLLGDIFARRGLQGDVALKVGDKGGALAAYRSALQLDPGYVQVWVDLGRLHEEREEWREAQEAYERALEVLPTFSDANLALADLLRRSGRAPQAIRRLAETLEQDPYDLPALLLLGRALLDDKRHEAALEAFRRALKFDPDQVEAVFQLGVALARLHRYAEAVQAWERVTRLDPSGPFAQRARMHARTALDLQHIFASDAA